VPIPQELDLLTVEFAPAALEFIFGDEINDSIEIGSSGCSRSKSAFDW
jgi:hypothetical protein